VREKKRHEHKHRKKGRGKDKDHTCIKTASQLPENLKLLLLARARFRNGHTEGEGTEAELKTSMVSANMKALRLEKVIV